MVCDNLLAGGSEVVLVGGGSRHVTLRLRGACALAPYVLRVTSVMCGTAVLWGAGCCVGSGVRDVAVLKGPASVVMP